MAIRTRSSRPDPQGPEQRTVALDHPDLTEVTVRVRRNRRARHVRLHVDEQGDVTASVPARFSAARLDPIVRERADWLHEVLTRMALKSRDTEVDLERGDPVRWLGQWVPTSLVREGKRASVRYDEPSGRLELRVPEDGDAHDALLAWYRREARRIFEERVDAWGTAIGLQTGKVSVREQRTRWGSCTHRGDLSFNWRLVLAPPWVLDSIVVHELCHIDELNHSDRFWAILDERYPRHQEASDWLRDHGPALRVTRPSEQTEPPPVIEREPVASALRPPRRKRRGTGPVADQTSLF
jgi:predicted metal-dependent hydrolase